jgi:thiamine pyrophosphokinase
MRARQLAASADLLIAANGGAAHLAAMGLTPHAIIGDSDSLARDPWPGDAGIARILFPAEKDRSDAELAVEWAFAKGAQRVLLLAGMGGRVDHALANCAILFRYHGRLGLWDDGFLLVAVAAGGQVVIETARNAVVSLIPFTRASRARATGLKYALDGATLRHASHGLSNAAVAEQCTVAVLKGSLIVGVEGACAWSTR